MFYTEHHPSDAIWPQDLNNDEIGQIFDMADSSTNNDNISLIVFWENYDLCTDCTTTYLTELGELQRWTFSGFIGAVQSFSGEEIYDFLLSVHWILGL